MFYEMITISMIGGLIAGVVFMSLLGMMKLDKEHGMRWTPKVWLFLGVASIAAAWIWCVKNRMWFHQDLVQSYGENGWYFLSQSRWHAVDVCWIILHIYFISCSVTDHMTCQVYDLFQYAGIGAAGYILLVSNTDFTVGASIILFAFLQYLVFMRFYGKADGMAFMIAAVAEAALGYDSEGYYMHMILSYLLLSLVQGIKGNIGRKGRLKKAVPFMPYITIGFWIMIFCR